MDDHTETCCKLRLPWLRKNADLDETGHKYGRCSETSIPMGPMYHRPMDSMAVPAGAGHLTPCCSPALAHHSLLGPTTVFLCSSMTPMSQQPLLTQAHSVYSQFTNTSSLGDSSNELGQRPPMPNIKD
ncbi:unnamed protein product [Echinostoma caproni]|uniref:Protein pangolin n=1 Tax=Echinostoma caproni TaxID=27848 RepID=A0A183A5Y9_9TREM|nr:unnamed protein product [Echinostoma caproni]